MSTKKNTSEFVSKFGITKRMAARELRMAARRFYYTNGPTPSGLRKLAAALEHGASIR